jgi:hypothetical protein
MGSENPTLNDHAVGAGFDRDICTGESPDVDGPCPKLKDGVVSRCGCCGCPLATMDLLQAPPLSEQDIEDGCIRYREHTTANAGGA